MNIKNIFYQPLFLLLLPLRRSLLIQQQAQLILARSWQISIFPALSPF